MSKKTKGDIRVHEVILVDGVLLSEHPQNSNKQNRHVQRELKKSIKENGFDENLIVCPRDDGEEGYWVVSGNHRFRAGSSLGMKQFPCVVREDWNTVDQQIQLVRRNYVRGKIDKTAFTSAVNRLSEEAALDLDTIYERMGFEDADLFAEYYQKEQESESKVAAAVSSNNKSKSRDAAKVIDDLGLILSSLFERYGDTVPQSFIVFPAGGKNHMYVQTSPALKRILEEVAEMCVQKGMDMNIILGGLLAIGMENSHFKTQPKVEEIVESGSEVGSSELDLLVDE